MGESQHEAQHEFSEYKPLVSFGFVLVFLAVLFVLFWSTAHFWRNKVEDEKYNEAIEELELDVVGLTVSFGITQALRHAIVGKYPPSAHFFIQKARQLVFLGQGSGDDVAILEHPHVEHKPWQRWFMFVWSV